MVRLLTHIKSMANKVYHISKKEMTHPGSKYNSETPDINIF